MSPCERIGPLEARLEAYSEARDVAAWATQFDKYDRIAYQERARWEQKMRDTLRALDASHTECDENTHVSGGTGHSAR